MADFGNLGFSANPYFQQSVNDSLGDTVRAYNLTTQPAFNSAMVNSGSFGNEGVAQMNGEAQRQLQTSLGRQANDMQSGNFWQGMGFDNQNYWNNQNFNRNVYNDSFGQGQQQYQNALNLLGLQNSTNNQNLGFGTQIQNAPMNYYSNFNQQANSIGQGYGSSSGTQSAQGSPLMGALGGAQLGNYFSNAFGSSGSSPTNYGSDWNTFGTRGGTMNNPSAYVAPSE